MTVTRPHSPLATGISGGMNGMCQVLGNMETVNDTNVFLSFIIILIIATLSEQ